jgi:prepilin-type N-terminal cleavage/methylation domain-containing protein
MIPELIKSRDDLPFPNEAGFTLIEVIVALAILTIGILAVNAMQTAAVRGNMAASDITIASTWAADRVEQIFGMEYDDFEDLNGNGLRSTQDTDDNGIDNDDEGGNIDGISNFGLEQNTAGTADYNDVSPDGRYTVLWNVAEEVPMPDTKTIYVIVNNDVTGKSVTLKHIKARYF